MPHGVRKRRGVFREVTEGLEARVLLANTAPTLDPSGNPSLYSIEEDVTFDFGTPIPNLIASMSPGGISDPDAGASQGIAIIGVDSSNGKWEYYKSTTNTWSSLLFPSESNALLLGSFSTSKIRFKPNPNFNGLISDAITFRAWDLTTGTHLGFANTVNNGGSTAFSSAVETASIYVLPKPDPPTGVRFTPGAFPENAVPGAFALTLTGVDPDANQTFTYAITGGRDSNKFVLNGNQLFATETFDYESIKNDLPLIKLKITDQDGLFVEITTRVLIQDLNDPPTFVNPGQIASWGGLPSGVSSSSGALLREFLASEAGGLIQDQDSTFFFGMAITGVETLGDGEWQYSLNGVDGWTSLAGVSETSARLLEGDATTRIRYLQGSGTTAPGTAVLNFRAWDRTNGAAGDLANVLSADSLIGPFSLATKRSELQIGVTNAAPVMDTGGSPLFVSNPETERSGRGLLIRELIERMGGTSRITDPQGLMAEEGVAITHADTSHGTWEFSLNDGQSWLPLGNVSNTSARLLASDSNTRIRFLRISERSAYLPNALEFRAWDQTTGSNGGLADTSLNGGTTAFSTAMEKSPGFLSGNSQLEQLTGVPTSPVFGLGVTSRSSPTLVDLDGDSDLDLVVGSYAGDLEYYKNTGTTASPNFVQQFNSDNPLPNLLVSGETVSSTAFVDLDADGDLDLVLGQESYWGGGYLVYYRNIGNKNQPIFEQQLYSANPFYFNLPGQSPTFGDLDGDGDFDLVVATQYGGISYYPNEGTPTNPDFNEREYGDYNPFSYTGSVSTYPLNPELVDLDSNGTLDLVVGSWEGELLSLINHGPPTAPDFNVQYLSANPLFGLNPGMGSSPASGDLDGDGDIDLIVGNLDGGLTWLQNIGPASAPLFVEASVGSDPFYGQDVGDYSSPAYMEYYYGPYYFQSYLPGMIVGGADGRVTFYKTTYDPHGPAFIPLPDSVSPFTEIDVGTNAVPTARDLHRDGLYDLLIGNEAGELRFFKNTTYRIDLELFVSFTEQTGVANPFDGIDVGDNAAPAFVDLDNDNDFDLVVGNGAGELWYFKNTGSDSNPVYVRQTGADNPFESLTQVGRVKPAFVDLNDDSLQDLVLGRSDGTFLYFENIGTTLAPLFDQRDDAENPFSHLDVGTDAAPMPADLNGDGVVDLISGNANGVLQTFVSRIPVSPTYVQRQGLDNPLDGLKVNPSNPYYREPAEFADLDDDGDLDMVVGVYAQSTEFQFFRNTGSNTNPVYELLTGNDRPMKRFEFMTDRMPLSLGDLDGDGDLDMVAGSSGGHLYFYENIGNRANPYFVYTNEWIVTNYAGSWWGDATAPTLGDVDHDGDLDILVTMAEGPVTFVENIGGNDSPLFEIRGWGETSWVRNIGSSYDYGRLTWGDVDLDGDLDLVGDAFGQLNFHRNSGSTLQPDFNWRIDIGSPLPPNLGRYAQYSSLADLDGDGDLDITFYDGTDEFAFLEAVMADLSLDVSVAGSGIVRVGDEVVYTVTLSNAGPDAGTDTAVAITLPTGFTGVTFTPSTGSYQQGHWVVPSLASGDSVTLTIRGRVSADSIGYTLAVAAEIVVAGISDPDSIPNNLDPLEDDQGSAGVYVNTAPVLNNAGNPLLTTIPQGLSQSANVGTLVSDLIARMSPAGGITDADPGALLGIAINGMSGTGTGIWQYSLDGGTTWLSVAATGNSNARLLAADATTRIRYIANTSFLGEAKISFVAWDRTSGVNGGTANVASRGGSTPFSLAYEYATQQVVNTAPILDANGSPTLDSITQNVPDTSNPGTLVATLISRMAPLGGITDPNPLAVKGIAINGLGGTTTGVWEYTVNNGVNWTPIGTTGNTNARLLAADANTRIRYRPNAGFIGEAKITFVAWDRTTGSNGGVANVTQRGGTTAFSLAYDYASIFVVNTAPVLNAGGNPQFDSIQQNVPSANNSGILVTDLIARMSPGGGISDSNPGALRGIAINGMTGTTKGVWEYSINSGASWAAIGSTGNLNARLLAADPNTRIRYQPNLGYLGEAKIAFVAWDRTSGVNGGVTNVSERGGSTPFSLVFEIASILVVNSAPVLTPSNSAFLDSIAHGVAGQNSPGTLISDLIARMSPGGGITDPNAGALQGIAINGMTGTGQGRWQYTLNNGALWNTFAVTGNTNARLLAADATTRIRWFPDTDFTGTLTLSFTAWDRTKGTNGGVADVSSRGGTTPYSLAYDYATLTVV